MRPLAEIRRMAARPITRPGERYVEVGGQAGRTGGGRLQMMQVQSVGADTLTCKTWDGSTLGSDPIEVAKPPLLRESVIDGQTRNGASIAYVNATTVTATDSVVETWKITLSYEANDIIYALRTVTGLEGVGWQDVNVDGRTWAKVEA